MKVTLLDSTNTNKKIPNEHNSFMFLIENISRALLQELSRHRTISLTVKSSRYTLEKDLKNENNFIYKGNTVDNIDIYDYEKANKYILLTNDDVINKALVRQLEELRLLVKTGKPNDKIKYAIPECYHTKLTLSVTYNDLLHLSKLRLDKSALHEFRILMLNIIDVIPKSSKTEFIYLKNKLTKDIL